MRTATLSLVLLAFVAPALLADETYTQCRQKCPVEEILLENTPCKKCCKEQVHSEYKKCMAACGAESNKCMAPIEEHCHKLRDGSRVGPCLLKEGKPCAVANDRCQNHCRYVFDYVKNNPRIPGGCDKTAATKRRGRS